jgi:uncharacterized protein (DUF302 family)
MSNSELGFEVFLDRPIDEAISRVTEELKKEGFGILTRIDVHKTLKEKINEDFRPYVILGACNPPLAFKSLTIDPTIGLMLPCNVTIEETVPGKSIVRLANPQMILGSIPGGSPELNEVALQVSQKIIRVVKALR